MICWKRPWIWIRGAGRGSFGVTSPTNDSLSGGFGGSSGGFGATNGGFGGFGGAAAATVNDETILEVGAEVAVMVSCQLWSMVLTSKR